MTPKILVILLAAIGVGIGLILFGVVWTLLGIVAVLAVLSTGYFIFAVVEVEKSWPVRYSKGERVSDIASAIRSWVFGLSSFLLWLLFFVVLYFT